MANHHLGAVLGHLRLLLSPPAAGDETDGHLLERFLSHRDEGAFAVVVQRHGPLVLGLCRRLLGNAHDAEDAFQATFLVLARRAATLDRRGSLAGWLYGVAYRVAVRARLQAARRRFYERQAVPMAASGNAADPAGPELRQILDEELHRLPEKYRAPIVLCYLEGKTQAEAARQLQWPLGTVRGRVARARDLLRRRLERRGVALTGAALAALLAPEVVSAAVPAAVARVTVEAALLAAAGRTAGTGLSATVRGLGEAVLRDTAVARWKTVAAVCLALAVTGVGAGVVYQQVARKPHSDATAPAAPEPQPPHAVAAAAFRQVGRWPYPAEVRAVAFAPDGGTLAAGGADATVRLWDVAAAQERRHFATGRHPIRTVGFSPDGKFLVAGTDEDRIPLWDLATGDAHGLTPGVSHGAQALTYSPDGQLLAAGGVGPPIHLWDLGHHRKRQLPGHPHGVTALAFAADNTTLASAGGDQQIRLWDAGTGQELHALKGHPGRVNALAFLPDGRGLLSAGADGSIRRWDVGSGKARGQFPGHPGGVTGLALAADGALLVSGGADGAVRLWDVASGKELARAPAHPGGVTALALARDGRTLATGGKDRIVILWRLTRPPRPG